MFLFCFIRLAVNNLIIQMIHLMIFFLDIIQNSSRYITVCRMNQCACLQCLVTPSYLTPCDPMDCSPPGSSVHGILQARTLEWVAIPFSRRWPRDRTQVSCTAGRIFTIWATRKEKSFYSAYWIQFVLSFLRNFSNIYQKL